MSTITEISEKLQAGKSKDVKALVAQALEEGLDPKEILEQGLLAGMNVVGVRFKANEVYVPEVLVAARAMKAGVAILRPLLVAEDVAPAGKVVIGTVAGDMHDIGKNLVAMMLEGKGLEVIDLGVDVKSEDFINTAIENDCSVICLSALLTTTMTVMKEVIELADKKGIRDRVKIMVGGAPVTKAFADEIGADGYTVDASSAADMALGFCRA